MLETVQFCLIFIRNGQFLLKKIIQGHKVGQNFLESTRLDDENAVEACLMEDTRLIEGAERIRNREDSDHDLRETMRKKDQKAGPSDLRYSRLQREKDLRDIIRPKPGSRDGSGTSALSAYESTSSEEEQVQPPTTDNSTPKRQRPLAPTDLRRKLDGEVASKIPKHPTQLSKVDLRRKLNVAQGVLFRDPVPQKMAPNCGEEHRQVQPPPPPNRNWWDDPEEDEEEKISENDISTDKLEDNDSS